MRERKYSNSPGAVDWKANKIAPMTTAADPELDNVASFGNGPHALGSRSASGGSAAQLLMRLATNDNGGNKVKLHREERIVSKSRASFVIGMTFLSLLAVATIAAADDVITDCGQICQSGGCAGNPNCREALSGKCKLTANVTCSDTESTISLEDGTDLDLRGYDITCSSTSCNYYAITMFASASKVTSDGTAGISVISGPFGAGIDCDGQSGSIVEKVTINDGIIAINQCQTVRNNVIGSSSQYYFLDNYGVLTTGISNSDSITDNYITGRISPISSSSALTLDVQRNVIHHTAQRTAISLGVGQTSSNGNAKFNIIFGSGDVLFDTPATDNVSYDGNFCDPDHPDCATCISEARCEPYTSPFTGN